MYNKSEIMTNAWRNYRSGDYPTFADALRKAWLTAKIANAFRNKTGYVNVKSLFIGDTIAVADLWGRKSNKVIASIEPASLGYAGFTIRFIDGDLKCFANYDAVDRVAVA